MPRKPQPWFRFYVETFTDRKIRRLSPAERWVWAALLGAARESPTPGRLEIAEGVPLTLGELAEYADVDRKTAKSAVEKSLRLGMCHMDEKTLVVTNFPRRQFLSDDTTARTRAHRERSKTVPSNDEGTFQPGALERSGNGRRNTPETETETETENVTGKGEGNRHVTRRASAATTPHPDQPPICSKHPDGNPTDQPCHGCARVRQWHDDEPKRRAAARAAAIRACRRCDPDGWQHDQDGQPTTTRCTHTETTP